MRRRDHVPRCAASPARERRAHRKIGIIGNGNVGSRLAALFTAAGHEVPVGSGSLATSADDAARFGDVVVLAIH